MKRQYGHPVTTVSVTFESILVGLRPGVRRLGYVPLLMDFQPDDASGLEREDLFRARPRLWRRSRHAAPIMIPYARIQRRGYV